MGEENPGAFQESMEPNLNGATKPPGGAGVPSQLDLAMQNMGKKNDMVQEMLRVPTQPQEFIARSVLTKQHYKSVVRFYYEDSYLTDDEPDIEGTVWYDMALTAAVDGRARDDVVQMYIGQPRGMLQGVRNAWNRRASRNQDGQ